MPKPPISEIGLVVYDQPLSDHDACSVLPKQCPARKMIVEHEGKPNVWVVQRYLNRRPHPGDIRLGSPDDLKYLFTGGNLNEWLLLALVCHRQRYGAVTSECPGCTEKCQICPIPYSDAEAVLEKVAGRVVGDAGLPTI